MANESNGGGVKGEKLNEINKQRNGIESWRSMAWRKQRNGVMASSAA